MSVLPSILDCEFPIHSPFPGRYYIRAIRGRTHGNVHNYSYWQCPECEFYPGDSEGPPQNRCLNCGAALYTHDPQHAWAYIEAFTTESGYSFRVLQFLGDT